MAFANDCAQWRNAGNLARHRLSIAERVVRCLMQVLSDAQETPDRHRRSLAQALPRPYSPPVAHIGSSGQPWHELQEQSSPCSDTSDPCDNELQQWPSDKSLKPRKKASS